jgi:hypothetical protein
MVLLAAFAVLCSELSAIGTLLSEKFCAAKGPVSKKRARRPLFLPLISAVPALEGPLKIVSHRSRILQKYHYYLALSIR